MRSLDLKVPPPAVALLIGTAMWFASRSGPSLDLSLLVRSVAGFVVAALGGAISLAGDIEFRRARTTVNPWRPQNTSSLVMSGIYQRTRNPMYLGLLLVVRHRLGRLPFLGMAVGWTASLHALHRSLPDPTGGESPDH
jgi:protein-S-isoprenylcysteine O-methyltransferase Ste14